MITLADMQNHFTVDLQPGPDATFDPKILEAGISADLQGRSFNHGLIRFHSATSRPRWTRIIQDRIRSGSSDILPLFFDWEGKHIFYHREAARTYFFDPSTNEMDWLTQSIAELLEKVCSFEGPGVMDAENFEATRQHLGDLSLAYNECVGFALPLFLGGSEDPSNREVSDMEVFWEINQQIVG